MDEIAALLDRAVSSQLASTLRPPATGIEMASRRLDVRRSLASVAVVVLLVVASVIGLASTGHASESGPSETSVAAATAPVVTSADIR